MERRLSASEQNIFFLDRLSSLNFATVGRVRGPLTLTQVNDALAAAARRHVLLRSRIVCDVEGVPWFREGGAIPEAQFARGPDWQTEAEREVNAPVDAVNGPLMRCVLVEHAPDDHTIILNFHHAIGDGWSGVYVLRDVVQAASGAPLEPLPDVRSVDERLPKVALGWTGFLASVKFVLREVGLALRHGVGERVRRESPALAHERQSRVAPRQLDAEFAARLTEKARAEHTTIHGALSAAIILATVADTERGRAGQSVRVGFGSPVNLRAELQPPEGESAGFFVSMLAWGGVVQPGADFWTLARTVRDATVRDKAQHLIWVGLRALSWVFAGLGGAKRPLPEMAAAWEKTLPATSGLTNLGRLGIETRFGELEIQEAHFLTCPASLGVWLSTATSLHGKIFWNFVFCEPSLSREHAEALADDAIARLRQAVA